MREVGWDQRRGEDEVCFKGVHGTLEWGLLGGQRELGDD